MPHKKKHRNACNCYCGNGIAMSVCMLWRKILVKQVYDFINKIEEYKLPFNLNMDIKVINEKSFPEF